MLKRREVGSDGTDAIDMLRTTEYQWVEEALVIIFAVVVAGTGTVRRHKFAYGSVLKLQ